jgi:hypothetical protein
MVITLMFSILNFPNILSVVSGATHLTASEIIIGLNQRFFASNAVCHTQ